MIGIGSGGLTGKGLFNSTQVRLDFLPEHHTDFIFSVLGEEMGFLGAAGVLLLYFLLIYRILWTATQAKDQFGALICCGVAIILSFQILVNIGMTISMMPVTGIPPALHELRQQRPSGKPHVHRPGPQCGHAPPQDPVLSLPES